ncbi:hypothetical protein VP424E501_P0131 [Vibrio phage 424E50-1]|nr:hypothetical protein VP424E501_P0131 [Vibrio phage 424E50-1]
MTAITDNIYVVAYTYSNSNKQTTINRFLLWIN